jgi:hypothetical protein
MVRSRFPKVLPCEQAFEPHLSGAIAHDCTKPQLSQFCVLGVAC